MNSEDVIDNFSDLRIFGAGGKRAPNKPLLILLALGKLQSNNAERLSFAECEKEYSAILSEFGRKLEGAPHPEYAFYRLKNDNAGNLWQIYDPQNVLRVNASGDVSVMKMRDPSIHAGFASGILAAFKKESSLITKLANQLLEAHFPHSVHQDILDSVGLCSEVFTRGPNRRDPKFRRKVLTAYEYQCSVCGFAMRLGQVSVALEYRRLRNHRSDSKLCTSEVTVI